MDNMLMSSQLFLDENGWFMTVALFLNESLIEIQLNHA